jgi:hypothetical protein
MRRNKRFALSSLIGTSRREPAVCGAPVGASASGRWWRRVLSKDARCTAFYMPASCRTPRRPRHRVWYHPRAVGSSSRTYRGRREGNQGRRSEGASKAGAARTTEKRVTKQTLWERPTELLAERRRTNRVASASPGRDNETKNDGRPADRKELPRLGNSPHFVKTTGKNQQGQDVGQTPRECRQRVRGSCRTLSGKAKPCLAVKIAVRQEPRTPSPSARSYARNCEHAGIESGKRA